MKNKEDLLEALKQCWLYIAAFVALLILAPIFRGEEITMLGLRIGLLLVGTAVVVFMRYQQLRIARRNAEFARQREEKLAAELAALGGHPSADGAPDTETEENEEA